MKIRDQVSTVDPRQTIQCAYAALSGVQDYKPGMQVMSWALLVHEAAQLLNLDPSELFDQARRVARDAKDHYSLEIEPLREYIRKQLRT